MMYVDFHAGDKDYKLRLSTRNIVMLEKQLGCNPLSVHRDSNGRDRMPTAAEMVQFLHCALLQFNHGISLDDAYDIFDAWLDEDHCYEDFLILMMEVYEVSGMIKKGTLAQAISKNAKNA